MARIEYTDASGQFCSVEISDTARGFVLGRSPSCHLALPSHSVGRNHGKIVLEDGRYQYQDLGSVNGSFVNDRRVTGAVDLFDGDRILLGEVTVRFLAEARRPTGGGTARAGSDPGGGSTLMEPSSAEHKGKSTAESRKEPAPLRELESLRTENESLRAQLAAARKASGRTVDAGGDRGDLQKTLAERDDEVRHLRGLMADGERRVKDAESRAAVVSSSLESVHAKYLDLRGQVQHLQSLLEATRAEGSEREAEAANLRDKVAVLTAQIENVRGRTSEASEQVSALKIRMTEKDREVERLLRELDIREYDLKALKEENERLEEYCATDTGRQQELERKVRNLEAVIEDNRNLIAELRRNLEDKDRELRQVRAGAGIADLEQERQRLLDDFHKKSRENDALRTNAATLNAELSGVVAERDDLVQKMRAIEEGGRTRRAEREDVTDHPDYRARVREIESRDGEIATLAREIEALREQNASRTEEAARLVSEASASREKARALELRVAEIEAAPVVDVVTAPVQVPKPGEDQLKALESVGAGLDALLDGLAVFQSELRQTADVLAALASSTDGIPGQVMEALHGATPDESAKAVRDLLRVVGEDSARVRAAWSEAERLWNPHS